MVPKLYTSLRVHICSGCSSADEKVTWSRFELHASYHIRSGSATNSDTPVCIKMLDDNVIYNDELYGDIGMQDVIHVTIACHEMAYNYGKNKADVFL